MDIVQCRSIEILKCLNHTGNGQIQNQNLLWKVPGDSISLVYKGILSVRPTAALTWSCCSWTPSREIRHGWGTGNRGCWRCRRFPGSTVGHLRTALPCWGSGLRGKMNIYVSSFILAGVRNQHKVLLICAGERLLSHTHAGGTKGSLFSATPGPWTGRPATWSPQRNVTGWRETWLLTQPELQSRICSQLEYLGGIHLYIVIW